MKIAALNTASLLVALTLSFAVSYSETHSAASAPNESPSDQTRPSRIVSASGVSDQILAEIAEPSRVVAISSAASGAALWRFDDIPRVTRLADLEAILALEPDIVFASALGGDRSAARLREAGIAVEEVGALQGFDELPAAIRRIGRQIGNEERAEAYATRLVQRMEALVAQGEVLEGLYLSVHGNHLYGGTRGSSYGDLLRAGGIRDVAAGAGHEGWPDYAPEDVLRMDPAWIVMPEGDPERLCAMRSMRTLRACDAQTFIEMDKDRLADPGPLMVEVAAELRSRVMQAPR